MNPRSNPVAAMARVIGLLVRGRVHLRRDAVGRHMLDGSDFVVLTKVVVDSPADRPCAPMALLRITFHFSSLPPAVNRVLSLIPIPLIVAQPGFVSKTWMLGCETGIFRGSYEWESVADAEDYRDSLPVKLLRKRAATGTFRFEVCAAQNDVGIGAGP